VIAHPDPSASPVEQRLYPERERVSKEDLMTIKAEDILAGSLFGDEEGESPGDDDRSSDGAKATARGNES
jgi:hypothetical protein